MKDGCCHQLRQITSYTTLLLDHRLRFLVDTSAVQVAQKTSSQ